MKLKNLKAIFIYVIIPTFLIVVLIFFLYQSNQRIKTLKSGIDLKPRPFSELLATDFADVKDEVADPSKCDGTKIVEQIKKSSTNPNLADKWASYDPNVDKLTILDNCWRQYENQYVRFKFRDLNGSLHMYGANYFSIYEASPEFPCEFIVKKINKNGLSTSESIINFFTYTIDKFLNLNIYKNDQDTIIYRANAIHYTYKEEEQPFYFIELGKQDKFLYILSHCKQTTRDILSTIEIKK